MAITEATFVDNISSSIITKHGKNAKRIRNSIFAAVIEELKETVPSVYHAILMTLVDSGIKPKKIDSIGREIKDQCVEMTIQKLPSTMSKIIDACSTNFNSDEAELSEIIGTIGLKSSDSVYHIVAEVTKKTRKYTQAIENFDSVMFNNMCHRDLLSSLKCSDTMESDSESEYETETDEEVDVVPEEEEEVEVEVESEEDSDDSEYETETEEDSDDSEYETETEEDSDEEAESDQSDMWLVTEDKRSELENQIKNYEELINNLEKEAKELREKIAHNNHTSIVFLSLASVFFSVAVRFYKEDR
jgi:hypothetical protein